MSPRQFISNALRCVGFVCEFTIGGPLAWSLQVFQHEERERPPARPPTGDDNEQQSPPSPPLESRFQKIASARRILRFILPFT
jgi:hypothetical protein